MRVWDTRTAMVQETLAGHESAVTSVVFSADGELLLSSDLAGAVRLWDMRTRRCLAAGTTPDSSPVYQAAIDAGKTTVFAATGSNAVLVLRAETMEVAHTVKKKKKKKKKRGKKKEFLPS